MKTKLLVFTVLAALTTDVVSAATPGGLDKKYVGLLFDVIKSIS